MIISFNRYNGGGGSGSGVTPEQVQQQIDSALTPYWESAVTESAITEAVSGLATEQYVQDALSGVSLEGFWNSAQTESAITEAVEGKADAKTIVDFDHTPQSERAALYATLKTFYDGGSGATINKNYDFYKTVNTWQGLKIDYYGFSGDTMVFGKVVSPENTADQVVYEQVMVIDSAGSVNVVTNIVGGASGETNSNILAAITSQAEYGAISGSVKTGDLIQAREVDINDDGEDESGLFEATVVEEEDGPGGDIIRFVYWERRDNADSVSWAVKTYPWMADNDVWPVDFGEGSFLISNDDTSEDEAYNGIGFDADGKPVITHISPEYDEQTGEITGITREDRDILGELDTLDEVVATAIVDLNNRVQDTITVSNFNNWVGNEVGSILVNAGVATRTGYTYTPVAVATQSDIQDAVHSYDIRHIVKLTQAEYDQLVLDDEVDPETFYIIVNNN